MSFKIQNGFQNVGKLYMTTVTKKIGHKTKFVDIFSNEKVTQKVTFFRPLWVTKKNWPSANCFCS
jgi:hypothetical protein